MAHRYTTIPLFFLLMLTLVPNIPIQHASAQEYDVFTISGASANIGNAGVYHNTLFVGNESQILVYDLSTKAYVTSLPCGDDITELLVKGDELYVEYTDTGATYYRVYTLPSLNIKATVEYISWTNFDGVLENLACIVSGGMNYWAWTTVNVPAPYYKYTMLAYDIHCEYQRFLSYAGTRYTAATPSQTIYVYNQTDDSEVTDTQILGSAGRQGKFFWRYTITGATDDKGMIGYTGAGYEPNIYMQEYAVNATETYAGVAYYGISLGTMITGLPSLTTSTYYVSTIFSVQPYPYMILRRHIYIYSNHMYVTPFSSTGVGSTVDVTLENTPPITSTPHTFTAHYYKDSAEQHKIFAGFVASTKIPYAEKMISTYAVEVGRLPESLYTPTDTRVFSADANIVAIFIQSGITDLFVCRNLIESQYLYGGGYGVNTLAPQVHKLDLDTTMQNLLFYTRWYGNISGTYTKLASRAIYIYIDGAYFDTYYTDGNGEIGFSLTTAFYPRQISQYCNTSGYTARWLNITWYASHPNSLDCSVKEMPVLSAAVVDDQVSNYLLTTIQCNRFSGEPFTSEFFKINTYYIPLVAHTYLDVIGTGYYKSFDESYGATDAEGRVRGSLSYNEEYSYRLTVKLIPSEQYYMLKNFTAPNQISISYNAGTGEMTIGEYTKMPEIPKAQDQWNIEPTDYSSLPNLLGLITSNTGFVLVFAIMTVFTFGMAMLGAYSAATIFAFADAGLFLGFAGYNGMLPFPILAFSVFMLALGVALFLTKMLTGSSDRGR